MRDVNNTIMKLVLQIYAQETILPWSAIYRIYNSSTSTRHSPDIPPVLRLCKLICSLLDTFISINPFASKLSRGNQF
jgi:hypothetical protein